MVRMEVYTLHLLTPLAQLIRLCVVNGGLKLRFVNPSAGLLPWISGTRADAVMTGCAKYLTALRYQGEGAQRDPGTLNEILESFPGSFKTYHYGKEVAQNPCIILSGIAKPMSIARRWCNVCHKHIVTCCNRMSRPCMFCSLSLN